MPKIAVVASPLLGARNSISLFAPLVGDARAITLPRGVAIEVPSGVLISVTIWANEV